MINPVNEISSLSLTRGVGDVTLDGASQAFRSQTVSPGNSTGLSFVEVLGDMTKNAMNNVKQAEISSFEGIKGTASTREVVDAVLSAEQSLQTAIALRDKIVSAFLDITKMQI